jgi:LPS-assembly lipoprotein
MSLLKWTRTLGAAALLTMTVSGCGFHPLYGDTASGRNLNEVMKSVEIPPFGGRVAQRIRNELLYMKTGGAGDGGVKSEYRLDIAMRQQLRNAMVDSHGASFSQIVELDTEFRLVRLADNKVVMNGKATGRAAFDRNVSVYSNMQAQQDAENRAAQTVSETIRVRVAAFLSGNA